METKEPSPSTPSTIGGRTTDNTSQTGKEKIIEDTLVERGYRTAVGGGGGKRGGGDKTVPYFDVIIQTSPPLQANTISPSRHVSFFSRLSPASIVSRSHPADCFKGKTKTKKLCRNQYRTLRGKNESKSVSQPPSFILHINRTRTSLFPRAWTLVYPFFWMMSCSFS